MAQFEEAVATTLQDQSEETADGVLAHNPLLAVLDSKGLIRKFKGGYEIRKTILFNDTNVGGFYSGMDSFNLTPAQDIDALKFAIKQAYEPFIISGRDKRANTSEEQIVDLVAGKMKATRARLRNLVSTSLKGDGTLYSGKGFDGIKKMVASSPTSGSYGGLTRSGNWYVQNQAVTGVTFTAANIQAELTGAIIDGQRGDEGYDFGFMYPTVWKLLHQSMTAIQRIQNSEKGKSGFKHKVLNYDGVDFYFDGGYGGSGGSGTSAAVVESNTVRLFNTDYMSFDVDSQSYFTPLAPTMDRPTDQDGYYTVIIVEGNLCTEAPNFHKYVGT